MQETFENVLELASKLHLNCLTQKCEEMLASSEFELTTGSSETDCHSVVRWAHIAQKHHLVVRSKNSFYGFRSLHTTAWRATCHSALELLTIMYLCVLHLQALQLRCEQFMCNNFHRLLNDPLLQVSSFAPACFCLFIHQSQLALDSSSHDDYPPTPSG